MTTKKYKCKDCGYIGETWFNITGMQCLRCKGDNLGKYKGKEEK